MAELPFKPSSQLQIDEPEIARIDTNHYLRGFRCSSEIAQRGIDLVCYNDICAEGLRYREYRELAQ
jgi:hypothetical protein